MGDGHSHDRGDVARHREGRPGSVAQALAHGVLVVALVLAIGSPAAAKNLVLNGDFEAVDGTGMPENWAARAWSVKPEASATTRPWGVVGPRCLEINLKAGKAAYGCFSRAIDVSALTGDRLLFSCRYRTVGSPNVQAMVVSFKDDFMQAQWETRPLASEARALIPAARWETAAWYAERLPGARQVVVVFQIHSPGTLLVDGIVVRSSPDEVECQELEVGRVTAPGGQRQAHLRLLSRAPGVLKATLALTTLRERRLVGRTLTSVTLESGKAQEVAVRYPFAAAEAHQAELALTDPRGDDMLWFRRLEVPGLIDAHIEVPAFRGTIETTEQTPELVVAGRVFAAPDILAQVKLSARLLGTGAEATETKGITRLADGSFRLVLPTEGMLIGDHQVRIEAAAAGGGRVAATVLAVRRVRPTPNGVSYDASHRLLVGGKQLFPVGIYYTMSPQDLEAAKAAGFNLVMVPSPKASYVLAESAAAKDMGMVIASPSTQRDFWQMRQEKFGTHPALIGWEVLQRPDAKLIHPDMMLALYQIMQEVSPTHPVATTLCFGDTMADYARATDVIIPWELPLPQLPLSHLGTVIDRARDATSGRKPIWAMIQATGNAWATDRTLDEKTEGRLPTPREVRALAYLALVHGADGLLYYAYTLIQSDKERNFRLREDAPDLWAAISSLNGEIAALAPVLGGRSTRVMLPPAADGLVHMTRWVQGDQAYVIAVNTADAPTITTFSLPGCAATQLDVMFEKRALTSARPGQFGDSFEPYGVHVYSMKHTKI